MTIHMVCSLDGFVARSDESVDWMKSKYTFDPGEVLRPEQITTFLDSIDCYVMGSRTYELALKLGWPYGDKPVYVFTSRNLQSSNENIRFVSGNPLDKAIKNLKTEDRNIWMVGGPSLATRIINLGLADGVNLTIIPMLLGQGIPLFTEIFKEHPLRLQETRAYKDGSVSLWYELQQPE